MMLLTETKISATAYCWKRLGYSVNLLAAGPSSTRGSQGGIRLVIRERPVGWGIESMRYHGMNMVICKIVNGPTQTPLVGA